MSDKTVTLLRTQVAALEADAAAKARQEVCAEVNRILDTYNTAEDGDTAECAPEDRWRLYRDLSALTVHTTENEN